MKTSTIFSLGGDIWGYDIELFNCFHEKEILLEPERKFIINNVLPPINGIIYITCSILDSPLIIDNNRSIKIDIIFSNKIEDNNKINNTVINSLISQVIIQFEMETKINEKEEYTSGIGVLCNIPSKNIKALIAYNHFINLSFLNHGKKMILYINNQEKEINLKINIQMKLLISQ